MIEKYLNKIIQGDTLQVLKSFPDECIDLIVTSPPYWCYDEETEVLTEDGWKLIKDVSVSKKVMTLNPNTNHLSWELVTETFEYPYRGKMISFKSTNFDVLVTPNHNMFVKQVKGEPIREKLKKNTRYVSNKHLPAIHLIQAKDVKRTYTVPSRRFIWEGENVSYFELPNVILNYNKQIKNYPPIKIKIDDWLSFFGWWIAEGSVRGSRGGKKNYYEISIKQKIGENAEEIESILKKLPFKYSVYKYRNILQFSIVNPQLWNYLSQFGNSHTKFIPKWIKKLTPDLLNIFLNCYLEGNGKRAKKNIKNALYHRFDTVYSVSKTLRDDIVEIALKIGMTANINLNTVTFLRRKSFKIGYSKREVIYNGNVYCLNAEHNNIIYVRRSGKSIFSGNSLRDYGDDSSTIWNEKKRCKHQWVNALFKKNIDTGFQERLLKEAGKDTKLTSKNNTLVSKSAFCSKCGAFRGQLGLEPSLDLYISHLLQITVELKRVLKKTGILFWNHGNSYGGNNSRASQGGRAGFGTEREGVFSSRDIQPKCLSMQNYRLILRMIDEQGWLLRNTIIWQKLNPMPSSTTDRLTNTYEPIFFLVKNKKYWFDLDAIRVPIKCINRAYSNNNPGKRKDNSGISGGINTVRQDNYYAKVRSGDVVGKNPGDIFSFPTQPFSESHFACFPEALIEPIVKSGCPIDGILLDPFAGAGTSLLVAKKLGRNYIGIEIKKDYCDMARRRLNRIPEKLSNWIELE